MDHNNNRIKKYIIKLITIYQLSSMDCFMSSQSQCSPSNYILHATISNVIFSVLSWNLAIVFPFDQAHSDTNLYLAIGIAKCAAFQNILGL